MATQPWQKFHVGTPSTDPNWTNPDCDRLLRVSHVAHVPTAVRIAEDGCLRADLVFDESKLNKQRIRVVWLSPNDWTGAGGFRYGNIRFTFDWASLIVGKQYYWVESIAYGIEACRILLTENDYGGILDPYDPKIGDGPWWLDSEGKHWWNGNYCLEVMIEGDIPVAKVAEVDFVKHHPVRCSIDYRTCSYCGSSPDEGGAQLIAVLASRRLSLQLPGLVEDEGEGLVPSFGTKIVIGNLLQQCRMLSPTRWGALVATDPVAAPTARAMLGAVVNGSFKDDGVLLASLFKSRDDVEKAVASALAESLGLPDASKLLDV